MQLNYLYPGGYSCIENITTFDSSLGKSMNNEFSIRINRDAQGNKLSLENITTESADVLIVFLESLSSFAKLHDSNSDIRLSLKNGSIVSALVYPAGGNSIADEISSVIDRTSTSNDYIKLLKAIQGKIKENGFDYSVIHKVGNQEIDVTPQFKSTDFRLRRRRMAFKEEVYFISGELFESGGKSRTNVHLACKGDEYTVQCTQEQAIALNTHLYRSAYLATIKRWGENQKPEFQLIDFYADKETYDRFSRFFNAIKENGNLDRYDVVHDQIVKLIEEGREEAIIKLMRLYNFYHSDRGVVRTVLMTLKPIVATMQDGMVSMYNSLSEVLRTGNKHNRI